jgi:hypothetical protein
MNERIQELAEQAGVIPGIIGLNRFTYFDTEKFAELIVRECADIAQEIRWAVPLSQEQIARAIRQHFGVE